jgi:hypothetical protein
MPFHHTLYIEKPESVTSYAVFVSGGNPVEFVVNIRQVLPGNPDAIILYFNHEMFPL